MVSDEKYIKGQKNTHNNRLVYRFQRRGLLIAYACAKTPLMICSAKQMSDFFVELKERSILSFIAELVNDYRINRLQKWHAAHTEKARAVALTKSGH